MKTQVISLAADQITNLANGISSRVGDAATGLARAYKKEGGLALLRCSRACTDLLDSLTASIQDCGTKAVEKMAEMRACERLLIETLWTYPNQSSVSTQAIKDAKQAVELARLELCAVEQGAVLEIE